MNKHFIVINTFMLTIVLSYYYSFLSYHFSFFIKLIYEQSLGSMMFHDALSYYIFIAFFLSILIIFVSKIARNIEKYNRIQDIMENLNSNKIHSK